ncbi:MAG: TlpA family protein disulfide reductase [Bryobacteraceae bacterium]|nr:TlpA family protein disulfide reductase [Bryobacteraceae bacterium]
MKLVRLSGITLVLTWVASASVIQDVRQAIAAGDFKGGEERIASYRAQQGVTPEMLEALSWMGRGALAARDFDKAEAYAQETHQLVLEQLKKARLDDVKHLPIALGAAIEVQAQVLAARGERASAIVFLNEQMEKYRGTSIRTRVQKNINLLSLEGKKAIALETKHHLGPAPQPLSAMRGSPVLLFFWAHWCGDCKRQGPVLARLQSEFPGLKIVAPTQLYGFTSRGQEAAPDAELKYIDEIRKTHYPEMLKTSVPISDENFKSYGVSTTPTLVLLDGDGIVRLYRPGAMPQEELAARLKLLSPQAVR